MTVSKTASDVVRSPRATRREPVDPAGDDSMLQLGELSGLLGYSLKRAQLKVFEDFLRCKRTSLNTSHDLKSKNPEYS